ncbi:MarR family transcriptional regulator [Arthrobacter cryoconiti]|uniref:MarR family transcriptional regulator n=1 Tax=Arthrobacter cryoconiti TaxID=748907 RepID=A0ABV8R2R4_9MICC|nr:helix-turn-helix domain-containing protein [Arthrobacter cryoconiti]MCC9067196.1 MarR family transcriptional regulator [Arthrobacter cryoconiti]
MFVMTIDQRGSRQGPDLVPELLSVLADIPVLLAFERSVGDEVQGLLDSPKSVIEVAMRALRSGQWYVGIGVGDVDKPLGASPREGSGAAFVQARQAVDKAKRTGERVPLSVQAAPARAVQGLAVPDSGQAASAPAAPGTERSGQVASAQATSNQATSGEATLNLPTLSQTTSMERALAARGIDERARAAEAVLVLIGDLVRKRSEAQWRVLAQLDADPMQRQVDVAVALGISPQAVSRAILRSGWQEELAGRDAAALLLDLLNS